MSLEKTVKEIVKTLYISVRASPTFTAMTGLIGAMAGTASQKGIDSSDTPLLLLIGFDACLLYMMARTNRAIYENFSRHLDKHLEKDGDGRFCRNIVFHPFRTYGKIYAEGHDLIEKYAADLRQYKGQ